MAKVIYEVVEHDGGWAYRADGVTSETYRTHDSARRAAERAAAKQQFSGLSAAISFQDRRGFWHEEFVSGNDRPRTEVRG